MENYPLIFFSSTIELFLSIESSLETVERDDNACEPNTMERKRFYLQEQSYERIFGFPKWRYSDDKVTLAMSTDNESFSLANRAANSAVITRWRSMICPSGFCDWIKCQCTQNVLAACLVEFADVFSPTISLSAVTTSSFATRLTYRAAIRVRSQCIYQSISVKSNETAMVGLTDDRLRRQRRVCWNTVMIVLVE